MQRCQARPQATRHQQRIAVMFLDLDNFNIINDSFGQAVGNALLVQVGARVYAALRDNDTLARLEDDKFAIFD
jgi:diguanylate cyclase (GGDEF)-like protein